MSRSIEVSGVVIKKPHLLKPAIQFLNDLKNYGVVNANYQTNKDGAIIGGSFHLQTNKDNPFSKFAKGSVWLKFEGKSREPVYTAEQMIENGHFRLYGDEDFVENKVLGTDISDAYSAQVAKEHFDMLGLPVEISVDEQGAIIVEAYEKSALASMI